MKELNSHRPVKQRRALLESNPPRDSWIERRRNKIVPTFGEAQTSPEAKRQTFISEPEHALQNSSKTVSKSSKSFSGLALAVEDFEQSSLPKQPSGIPLRQSKRAISNPRRQFFSASDPFGRQKTKNTNLQSNTERAKNTLNWYPFFRSKRKVSGPGMLTH